MGSLNPSTGIGRTKNTNTTNTTKTNTRMAQSRVPVTMRDFFFDDPFFKNSWDDFDKVKDAMFASQETHGRDLMKISARWLACQTISCLSPLRMQTLASSPRGRSLLMKTGV